VSTRSEIRIATVFSERVGRHPVEAGVLADLSLAALDGVDLLPGAVPCREHRVDRVLSARLEAALEHSDREVRKHDRPHAGVRLRARLPVGARPRHGLDRVLAAHLCGDRDDDWASPRMM